ncbi:MAG: glycoside hydrolase 5 family protein, partial [Planctomycetota bacterium]
MRLAGYTALARIDSVIVLSVVVFLSATTFGADWEMRVTDNGGLEVSRSQVPIVRADYCFWGANWKYAGAKAQMGEPRGSDKTFSGNVSALGLKFDGTVRSLAPNKARYTWTIEASRDLTGIIGGGLEFRLVGDSPSLGGNAAAPTLLAANKGWRWEVSKRGAIVAEFDKPCASVYFERGSKNQIRAMFVGQNLSRGSHTVSMTVTLPAGGMLRKTLGERYGPVEASKWYSGALLHDKSPVDISFLNHKPAGKFGFVKARGDKLIFENGEEVRFWGGNIAAYAIFADKEHIRVQAKRIAQLGYNLMRIHHHDSMGWVGRTVIDKSRVDSQHLDPEVMDRLDYWIKCLRDEGVYVWLDLHVGRLFKEGDGIGEGLAEMQRKSKRPGGAEGKGYCYFNDRIEQLMKDFNAKYMSHVNKYTSLAYKDDPAIMGLLITNENDITSHFGNLMLADKNNPWHNRVFEDRVKAFSQRHGFKFDRTVRTWEPGSSKLFLADTEYQWNRRMLAALDEIGVKVPISTTQMWGNMSLYGLPPLTAGGIVDVHSYGSAEALSANPRFKDNYVAYLATGQAYGKPVSITEWNVPYPKVDRFTAPLYVASISALQGWDAPMIYNYSQRTFGKPSRQGTWSTFSDVAITGMMPAAALLYRQGHVADAVKSYCIMLDRQKLYMESNHPKNMASLRTLVEQSKITIGLPDTEELEWDKQTRISGDETAITAADKDFIPAGRDFVRSDTGELARNWVRGYQTIDTERTQAVHG